MAIVSMSKLNLVALSYDKSAILNALQRTGATEVKLHYEAENTVPLSADCEQLRAYLGSLEAVLSCLSREAEEYNKANKIKTDALADGFEVAYNEFIAASGFKAEADALAERVNALADDRREATVRLAKLKKTAQTARLYSALEHPFDYYCNTTHTRVRVGSVPLNSADALAEEGGQEGGQELFCASVIASDGERALVVAAYHKAVASAAEEILQKYNFTACPFAGDTRTGAQLNAELEGEISALEERIAKAGAEIYGLNDRIRPLKIYCDYLGFEIEKCELSEKMRATQTTFLLEAYVPEHEAEAVRAARDRQGTSAIIAERSKAIADGKAAAARLDAAKVMLAAKRGVIDAVYARALEKLKALPQKDAVRLAEGLLLSYAEDGDELVFATNFAYKAQVLKLAVVAEKNLKNSGKTADIDGGFILIGKNSDKDLSYGALLALDREERQAEIAAKLFSDGVSNNA